MRRPVPVPRQPHAIPSWIRLHDDFGRGGLARLSIVSTCHRQNEELARAGKRPKHERRRERSTASESAPGAGHASRNTLFAPDEILRSGESCVARVHGAREQVGNEDILTLAHPFMHAAQELAASHAPNKEIQLAAFLILPKTGASGHKFPDSVHYELD
jgi:hypothetical protein